MLRELILFFGTDVLKELILLVLHISLFLIVLAIGLNADMDDAVYVLKRPRLLLRSFIAIMIAVPVFAAIMVAVLPLRHSVEVGIILMAVSPLPPFAPGKEVRLGGRKSYVYGLLVAMGTLSIIVVPVAVAILGKIFGAKAAISPGAVAGLVFSSVILPLAVGMIIRRAFRQQAIRAAPVTEKIGQLLLVVGAIPILIAVLPALFHLVGNGTILAIEAVVAVGLLAGHMLGGPENQDRLTLALSSATRHPVLALLIAGPNTTDSEIKAAILLFVIVGTLTAIPYQLWYKRRNPVVGSSAH